MKAQVGHLHLDKELLPPERRLKRKIKDVAPRPSTFFLSTIFCVRIMVRTMANKMANNIG
jgi:hypothetical protein